VVCAAVKYTITILFWLERRRPSLVGIETRL